MASLLVAALTLAAAGAAWGGLGWLMANIPPSRPLAVLAAYVFAFAAITSSGALLAWLALRPRLDHGRLRSPAGYVAHLMLLALRAASAVRCWSSPAARAACSGHWLEPASRAQVSIALRPCSNGRESVSSASQERTRPWSSNVWKRWISAGNSARSSSAWTAS